MSAKQQNISPWDELQNLALSINEGVVTHSFIAPSTVNAYGRSVQISTQGDLGFNLGLAATGLRTIAFAKGRQLDNAVTALRQATKQQLSIVLIVQYKSISEVMQFSTTGAIILSASTWQEAADFISIAHYTAERSLIPVVVAISEFVDDVDESILFDLKQTKLFLGNPDEWIEAPTPAQKLIFGEKRKRIPNWFDPDLPITLGAEKNSKDHMFERAAHHSFFESHLQEIVATAFTSYNEHCGRKYESIKVELVKKALHGVITTGVDKEVIKEACQIVEDQKKHRVTNIFIHQLHPLPKQQLAELVRGLEGLTVFDQSSERAFTKSIQVELYNEKKSIFSAAYVDKIKVNSVVVALENMFSNGKREYWLDIPVSKEKSRYPKHDVLLNHINRAYPSLVDKNVVSKNEDSTNISLNRKVPQKIRQFKDAGPAYTKVSRFYDDTALLYDTNEMIADPFQAVAVTPSDTASFKDIQRQFIPKFIQNKCTGCGDCFVVCPHSALPPLAINVRNLIEGGMATSKSNGKVLKSFIPLTKAIATACNEEIKANRSEIASVADFLEIAAPKVFKTKGLVDEKLAQAQDELKTLLSLIGKTPVAITELFFTAQNIQDPNEGELFTLGLDTSACVGCGICASSCEEEALEMIEQSPEITAAAEESFSCFEELPDTDGYILERQVVNEEYDSLAAVLLSRPFYQSMNGATLEHEPAQKVMLHLTAAMAELAIQPKVKKTIAEIDELITKLESFIQKDLNEALPAKDFDSLNEALKSSNGQRIPFDKMIANWSNQEHLKLIDTADLKLRMDLIHDLKEFKWALNDGPTGLGRARYSLLIDSSLKGMVPYPWSTFTTPVLVNWSTSAPAMAEGLVQGCIRHTIDNIKIIRRAQLVAQKKYNPAIHDKELAALVWENLTNSEQAVVMPVLLVVRKDAVENNRQLLQLLHKPWPIKIVVLDEAVSNPDTAVAELTNSQTQLIPLIAQQKSIVLKSSLADKEHLYRGLHAGLSSNASALFWLLAPRANAHHTPWLKWPKLNAMAFNSRAFTHLYFNPAKKERMLSSSIEIENNPLSKHDWKEINFEIEENNEVKIVPYKLTWADWAYTQHAWRNEYKEIPNDAPTLTMAEYLTTDPKNRNTSTPVIFRQSAENALHKYAVSEHVVAATEAVLTSWNVLQEIAGIKTAFPDKLRNEIEIELTSIKNEEILKIEKAHKEKIASLEDEYLEKMKEKINNNLMNLSKLMKN